MNELNLRFTTIEWCLKKENEQHVQRIKHLLSGFVNINAVLQRIINNHGKTNDWKSFKRTVYHASSICELCASFPEEQVKNTFIEQLGSYCKGGLSVNGILFALDKIVDLEAIDEKKRFIVKMGLNQALDIKREELNDFVQNCSDMKPDTSMMKLNQPLNAFQVIYYPEVGFLIGTNLKVEALTLNNIVDTDEIEIVFQTNEAVYFKTPNCKMWNQKYDKLMTEIVTQEMEIFQKLILYINENFAELAEISKLCAKLDCLIAFAKVAEKYQYVRPNITKDRKIEIINGRHPLLEHIKEYVPSTTLINEQNNDFINIIRAPNSSGKSIYVKQIALICFMAHIGCFVPASENCNITLLHSIYTRIYTPESIYNNESAFMSDLQQMSKIIMNSTDRSLILIDEFGKGTHYKDGIALLTATIEHFVERGKEFVPYIFITTHYPQVHQLLQSKDLVNLKTIKTRKNDTNVFQSTYRIVDGVNEQVCTEFPESKKIIFNIFNQKAK
jgi:DNA mismatch repair protein MSH5